MPHIKKNRNKSTPPEWAQEELDRHAILATGGNLERADFTLPNADDLNVVPAGTLVGRTYAEKEAGLGFGPADVAADEQIFLTIHDVDFDDKFFGVDGHVSLYRHDCQITETSIPGWASFDAATKAKIRELYTSI